MGVESHHAGKVKDMALPPTMTLLQWANAATQRPKTLLTGRQEGVHRKNLGAFSGYLNAW